MELQKGITTLKKIHTKLLHLQEQLKNEQGPKTDLMQQIMRLQREYNEVLEKTRSMKKVDIN